MVTLLGFLPGLLGQVFLVDRTEGPRAKYDERHNTGILTWMKGAKEK